MGRMRAGARYGQGRLIGFGAGGFSATRLLRYGGQRARKTTRGARALPGLQAGELHGRDYGRLAAGVWSPRNQFVSCLVSGKPFFEGPERGWLKAGRRILFAVGAGIAQIGRSAHCLPQTLCRAVAVYQRRFGEPSAGRIRLSEECVSHWPARCGLRRIAALERRAGLERPVAASAPGARARILGAGGKNSRAGGVGSIAARRPDSEP